MIVSSTSAVEGLAINALVSTLQRDRGQNREKGENGAGAGKAGGRLPLQRAAQIEDDPRPGENRRREGQAKAKAKERRRGKRAQKRREGGPTAEDRQGRSTPRRAREAKTPSVVSFIQGEGGGAAKEEQKGGAAPASPLF